MRWHSYYPSVGSLAIHFVTIIFSALGASAEVTAFAGGRNSLRRHVQKEQQHHNRRIPFVSCSRKRAVAFSLKASNTDKEESSLDWDSLVSSGKQGEDDAPTTISSGRAGNTDLDRDEMGNVHIPSTGISVSDEMLEAQKDKYQTEVVPIKDLPGVAQLVTTALLGGSFEPVRYLVALSPPQSKISKTASTTTDDASSTEPPNLSEDGYVIIDVPPFSDALVEKIKAFAGGPSAVKAMLVTTRDAIHYNEAPAVFAERRANVDRWKQAFPGLSVVAYRLDIPRDCREDVTICLDGYGPFALEEGKPPSSAKPDNINDIAFVETGRPLTYDEWDFDTTQGIISGKIKPPDDDLENENPDNSVVASPPSNDADDYSPKAIRDREEGKFVLAIFTPGHSFGSMSYVFPEMGVCCSGFTVPVEDNRSEENGGTGAGPAMDCRGYITTSRAGMSRQMESARKLVESYSDRFKVVLPSRGDPLFLEDDADDRKETLLDTIDQYDKIGKIYEQLGIISPDE